MTVIRIVVATTLPPDRVLYSGYDFGPRRPHIWPAVREEHFIVHSLGERSADVTEGTPAGIGINWERCDYDWSVPDRVIATVTDSNVYLPGSAWQLSATPTQDGGSRVEMIWTRRFRRSPRGMLFGTAFRTVGRPVFRDYVRKVISNLESLERAAV